MTDEQPEIIKPLPSPPVFNEDQGPIWKRKLQTIVFAATIFKIFIVLLVAVTYLPLPYSLKLLGLLLGSFLILDLFHSLKKYV